MNEQSRMSAAVARAVRVLMAERTPPIDIMELSRLSGIPKSRLYRKVNGGDGSFDTDEMTALAGAFGLSFADLAHRATEIDRRVQTPGDVADQIVSTFTPEAQESIRRAQEDLRPKRDEGEEPGASTGA